MVVFEVFSVKLRLSDLRSSVKQSQHERQHVQGVYLQCVSSEATDLGSVLVTHEEKM